jgi:hypothetical protein
MEHLGQRCDALRVGKFGRLRISSRMNALSSEVPPRIDRKYRAWRMRPMVQRDKRNASAVETYGFASLKRRQLGKRFEHHMHLEIQFVARRLLGLLRRLRAG